MRYSHNELVEKLPNWTAYSVESFQELVDEVAEHVAGYGRVWREEGKVKIATGGWSENEEIVSALMKNGLFVAMFWEASHRGGLFVFREPLTANIHERR
jgi:hypothetical protein